jgi:hypothetical protein
MKNITPALVVAIICLAFSFSGLVVLCIVMTDLRRTFLFILAWYFAAALVFYSQKRKYLAADDIRHRRGSWRKSSAS